MLYIINRGECLRTLAKSIIQCCVIISTITLPNKTNAFLKIIRKTISVNHVHKSITTVIPVTSGTSADGYLSPNGYHRL